MLTKQENLRSISFKTLFNKENCWNVELGTKTVYVLVNICFVNATVANFSLVCPIWQPTRSELYRVQVQKAPINGVAYWNKCQFIEESKVMKLINMFARNTSESLYPDAELFSALNLLICIGNNNASTDIFRQFGTD